MVKQNQENKNVYLQTTYMAQDCYPKYIKKLLELNK